MALGATIVKELLDGEATPIFMVIAVTGTNAETETTVHVGTVILPETPLAICLGCATFVPARTLY